MTSWTAAELDALCDIAEAAGAAILGVYARADFGTRLKDDHSPLTEADLLADRLIRERLAACFAGRAVVTEETPAPPDARLDAGFFLVDPLDGTREFVARNGEFTVNIAWVEGGRPLAGVVHAPVVGETFWGAAGVGAWKRDRAGTRPIRVAPPRPGTPLRVLASRSHGGTAQDALLATLPQPHEVVVAGSSLKFCRIAEGAADLYPRVTPTMPWDTAAGQAVLEAAGGVMLEANGQPMAVPLTVAQAPNPHFVAASDPQLARMVLARL